MGRPRKVVMGVLAVGILLLGACGQESPTVDQTPFVNRGLAYGEPCKPPCWEGLIPGTSTEKEVTETLARLQADGQIAWFRCTANKCVTEGVPGASAGSVDLGFQDRVLRSTSGRVYFDFSAQQLIDLIGEPTAVFQPTKADTSTEGHREAYTTCGAKLGQFTIPTELLYPERGACFTLLVDIYSAG